MVDVAAERERSLARRAPEEHRQRLRSRALRVLSLRWNASPQLLGEALDELYPHMAEPAHEAERAELLEEVLRVQTDERPRVDPSTIQAHAPTLERRLTPYRAPARGSEVALAASAPTTKSMPATNQKKTTPEQREEIRAFLRELRTASPELKAAEGRRRVEQKLGIEIKVQSFYPSYWHKSNPNAAPAKRPKLAAKEAPEVAIPPAPRREAAPSEEARSVHQTCEAGEGLHLEELDGRWRVRADLCFADRASAALALYAIARSVSRVSRETASA